MRALEVAAVAAAWFMLVDYVWKDPWLAALVALVVMVMMVVFIQDDEE